MPPPVGRGRRVVAVLHPAEPGRRHAELGGERAEAPRREQEEGRGRVERESGRGGAAAGALMSLSGPARAAGADEAVLSRLSALSDTLLVTTPESATALGLDTGARAGLKAKLSDRSWSDRKSVV